MREAFGPAADGLLKERLLRATNRSPLALMVTADREKALEQAATDAMWKTRFEARRTARKAERLAERQAARRRTHEVGPSADMTSASGD